MASSNIAKRPDGRWRARYRDAEGREHAKHFARKLDAQRWLDEVTASVVTGQYVDPRAGQITLKTYALAWQASHVSRDATARIVDNALRVHILPALGDRPIAGIRRSDVQAMIKTLSDSLAPGSVRNVYDVLNRIFVVAVEDRVLAVSPSGRVTLPALETAEVVPPTSQHVALIADAVEARYRGLVILLAGSGLRIGEALGLEVRHVDFLLRTVRVERQLLQSGVIGPTKTPKSARTVPVGQVVIDGLKAHLDAFPSPDALFATERGTPLTYRQWKPIWRSALAATALSAEELEALTPEALAAVKKEGRHKPMTFGTHDLRHFTASALISGGASVKQVQTMLGHSTAAITLRVYSHLWPGDDDRTRTVMDAALGPLADCVRTERASEG